MKPAGEGAGKSDGLRELAEGLVYRLDFVDAVVLFALLKRGPQLLTLELARVIACCAELEGLTEECHGAAQRCLVHRARGLDGGRCIEEWRLRK